MFVLTTGKPTFVVRRNLCRVLYFGRTENVLFAVRFYRAHDKEMHDTSLVCRALEKKTRGKGFVCRAFFHRARQTCFSPFHSSNKSNIIIFKYFAVRGEKRTSNLCICRAFFHRVGQTFFSPFHSSNKSNIIIFKYFAVRFSSTHEKHMCLPCAFLYAHDKVFFLPLSIFP
jgi:hypothetical protein